MSDFSFHLIRNCGHKVWMERHGRDAFYRIVAHALERGGGEVTGRYFDEKNRSVKSRRCTTDPDTIARVMQATLRFLNI